MSQWQKKFERWKDASAPVDVEEVKKLLPRIFGDRFSIRKGGSHNFVIDVHELQADPDFVLGILPIPVLGGQRVRPCYLINAYRAATLLDLYPPHEEASEDIEEHEKE